MRNSSFMSAQGCQTMNLDEIDLDAMDAQDDDEVRIGNQNSGYGSVIYQQIKPQQYQHMIRSSLGSTNAQAFGTKSGVTSGSINITQAPNYNNSINLRGMSRNSQMQTQQYQQQFSTLQARTAKSQKGVRFRNQIGSALATQQYPPMLPNRARMNQTQIGMVNRSTAVRGKEQKKNIFAIGKNFGCETTTQMSFPRQNSMQIHEGTSAGVQCSIDLREQPYMDSDNGIINKQKKVLRSANPSNNEMRVRREMQKAVRHSLHAQRQRQNDLSSLLPIQSHLKTALNSNAIKSEIPSCTTSQEIELPKSQEVSLEDPKDSQNERVVPILMQDQRIPNLAHHIFKTTKSQINHQRPSNVQRIREIKKHLTVHRQNRNDKQQLANTAKFGTDQSISDFEFSSSKIIGNPLQVSLFRSGSPDKSSKQKSFNNQMSQREEQVKIDEYLLNKVTDQSFKFPTYDSADNNRYSIVESDRQVDSIYQNQLTKKIDRLKHAKAGNPVSRREEKSVLQNPISTKSRVTAHSKLSDISVSAIQKHGPKRPTSQQLMRHYHKPVRCEPKCAKILIVQKQKQMQKNSEYKDFSLEKPRRCSTLEKNQGNVIEALDEQEHEESSSSWSHQSLKKNKTIGGDPPQSQEKIAFLSSPKTREGSRIVTARKSPVERQSSFRKTDVANIAPPGSGPSSLANLKIQPYRTSIQKHEAIKIEESQDDELVFENLQHKTSFLIEHGMIWDKYKFDPATIVDTLAKSVNQRNKNIDEFIEKIAGEYVAPEKKEEFRVDLMRYLQKQRDLLIIHRNQQSEAKVEEYIPKTEIQGPKSAFEAVPHDQIRCQVHQKITRALQQLYPGVGTHLPQCCAMEQLDNTCFDYEYQEVITKDNWIQRKVLGTAQPVYKVKGVWFKDEEMKEQYFEKYEDVDQQLLDRMEYYLKYQFKGMYESTKKKIKAIDAVMDMMKNKTLNGLEYKPADQKLAEEIQTRSIYDPEEDLKPINILQMPVQRANKSSTSVNPLAALGLKRTNRDTGAAPAIGGKVRAQDQQRLQNTLSRVVTQNIGLMLGSKVAKANLGTFAQVDEKLLYGANINQTNLMASKLALNDLLNHKSWASKNDIKLGETLQKKHDHTVKRLIYGQKGAGTEKKNQKKDPTQNSDYSGCRSGQSKNSMDQSEQEELFDKQRKEHVKVEDLIQAVADTQKATKALKKTGSDVSRSPSRKSGDTKVASKFVSKMLYKRYERQYQLRQEEAQRLQEEKQLKVMLWEDIPEHCMRKVRKAHQHYFRLQRDQERQILDQKSKAANYRSPSKIEKDKRALEEADQYLTPDLAKEEFIEIITDLIKLNISKQQQIVTEFKKSEDPVDQGIEESHEEERKKDEPKTPASLGLAAKKSSLRGAGLKVKVGIKLGGSSGITSTKQSISIFQDYIKQAAFYRDLKRNPNSFLKESQRYHIEFLNKCTDGNSLPIPAFKTMLQGKSLIMNNYYMEQALVDALIQHVDQTCQSSERTSIEFLVVYDCGLNDKQLASILQLLAKSPKIKHIKLGKSVLGPLSIQELCHRIKGDQGGKNHLAGLTINQALGVADNINFYRIFKQISSEGRVQNLKLMNVNLTRDKKVFDYLLKYLNACPHDLVTLKLSNNCFQSKHLVEISHALSENTYIRDLDLSSNKLCRQKPLLNQKIIHNLTIFAHHNIRLRHLNLRGMHLYLALEVQNEAQELKEEPTKCTGHKHKKVDETVFDNDKSKSFSENCFQRFMTVLVKSSSIQAIHLSDNGFSLDQKDSIYILFNVSQKKGKAKHCKLDGEAEEILEKINQQGKGGNAASPKHGDVTTVQINQLKELYNTYEVNNNTNLTDHAKVINNELLQNFNQTKNCELDGNKTDHALIDVFNDDIILHRKIGHSELVFDYIQNFFGSLSKDFGKNWQLATKDTVSDCFICQRHQYVQIFFRRATITEDFDIIRDKNMITILNRLYGLEDKVSNNYMLLNDEFHIPIILGSVTDWHAQEMIAGQVYIQLLLFYFLKGELRRVGNETEEFLKDPTKSGRRHSSGIYAQELGELFDTMIEKILANQLLIDREECAARNPLWYKLFHSFKKINRDAVTQVNMFPSLNKKEVDVFVFSGYLKPGLHSIIIYDPFEKLYYKKTIVVDIGKNSDKKIELENMLDELKSELVKKGSKTVNVFQQWHNDLDLDSLKSMATTISKGKKSSTMNVNGDSPNSLQSPQGLKQAEPVARISQYLKQAFNIDTIPKNFKPYFFVADQEEINNCLDLLQLHYREIKNLYSYVSTSRGHRLSKKEEFQYPFISQNRIIDFLEEVDILAKSETDADGEGQDGEQSTEQDPHLSLTTIKEIFVKSNVEYEDDDANPDDCLNRVELMEFLMRIAQAQRKLMLTDGMKQASGTIVADFRSRTISDQLKIIIQDKLLPYNEKHFQALLNFKDSHYLQSKSVSELLDANFRGVSLLYSQYQTKGYDKKFTVASLRNMLIDSRLDIMFSEEMILQLFAFGKMTVVNETNYPEYYKLEFIEFQVMLGLLAKIYFDCNMGAATGFSNEKDTALYEKITGQKIPNNQVQKENNPKDEKGNQLSILGPLDELEPEPIEFHPEMLLFILDILLREVNVSCQNFEDIENQKAFLENQI